MTDKFEQARDALWGTPGFQRRNSTITSPGWAFIPQATWIVETIRTDETCGIFLQAIDTEGGQRIVLPERVAKAIYRHYDSIMKVRRRVRAQRGAQTRRQNQPVKVERIAETGEVVVSPLEER